MNNKKRPILWKDITVVLLVKSTLFFFIWLLFFSNPNSKYINTNQAYVDHLMSQPVSKQTNKEEN